MVIRYVVKKSISFSITKLGGQAKTEKISIQPARIIELDTKKKSFRVINKFNEECIHIVSTQGQNPTFRGDNIYIKLDEFERKRSIYKMEQ